MSDTHLPDDIVQWPEDPYALLGVAEGIDRRELRRAYTKLIRIYKPEHFPEQFRRIRDAYEKLDGFLQYKDYFEQQKETEEKGEGEGGTGEEQAEAEGKEVSIEFAGAALSDRPDEIQEVRPQAGREDAVTRAWRKAISGDRAAAYRELRECERARPGDGDLCLRLYWLLVLSPKLDETRDGRDWLAAGLKKNGLCGPLMELYAREIQSDPWEVLHARCESLIRGDFQPMQLASFAPLRWEPASALGTWRVIPEDMDRLRERVFHADRAAWSRLLLSAVESLLWHADPQAESRAEGYRREADEYSEEHQQLENEFYRCDMLLELTSGWKKLGRPENLPPGVPAVLRDLLREGWLRPFGTVRPKLMSFWRSWVTNPRHGLTRLDQLHRLSAPIVHHLHFQVNAIYQQQHDYSELRDRDEVLKPLRNFYSAFYCKAYHDFRCHAMFFCIRHEISLVDFLELSWGILGDMQLQDSGLAESLHNDVPLHCMILACLAFWS